jgi:hypothetical protein
MTQNAMPPAEKSTSKKARPAKEKKKKKEAEDRCSDGPVRSEYMVNRLRLARNEQQANIESKSPDIAVHASCAKSSYRYRRWQQIVSAPTTSNRNIRLLELKTLPSNWKQVPWFSGRESV